MGRMILTIRLTVICLYPSGNDYIGVEAEVEVGIGVGVCFGGWIGH